MPHHWRCPHCYDTMPTKFERSHTRICEWIRQRLDLEVERLIDSLTQ